MNFIEQTLVEPVPDLLANINLPMDRLGYQYYPSPVDWAQEVLYFLLPDRFSDVEDHAHPRPPLDRNNLEDARGPNWRWDKWMISGKLFQGGTIKGMKERLGYIKRLGITAIWVGPVFKQRLDENTYHGYAIQNFLDVDPRFGDRKDLVEFVKEAHNNGIRVILDIVFNHMGSNFNYQNGEQDTCYDGSQKDGINEAKYKPKHEGQYDESHYSYPDIVWKSSMVFPKEFQDKQYFSRAGTACDLGAGPVDDPNAIHKRTDFCNLRDFNTSKGDVLDDLIKVYQYWIALTDCDGYRLDTLKHVTWEEAKTFCGAIREYAQSIGKDNFFLVAETTGGGGFGGDLVQSYYLDAVGQNLNAALDIGDMKGILNQLAKGEVNPQEYFKNFRPGDNCMGSHRSLRNKHVSILTQHDDHKPFLSEASSNLQGVVGTAFQLFTLGIPCIYYGTEQAFTGPEEPVRKQWLGLQDPVWGNLTWGASDIYTREAMFGPDHPRRSGEDGLTKFADGSEGTEDLKLMPGFGPFGTSGHHCFDENHPVYKRIATLTAVRQDPRYPSLRDGRQYLRAISIFNDNPEFKEGIPRKGELVAWSRILSSEQTICIVNPNGTGARGAEILVDANLSGDKMYVIASTPAVDPGYAGPYRVGSTVELKKRGDKAYIEIWNVPPSEVIVLASHQ
jgi:glycosidase